MLTFDYQPLRYFEKVICTSTPASCHCFIWDIRWQKKLFFELFLSPFFWKQHSTAPTQFYFVLYCPPHSSLDFLISSFPRTTLAQTKGSTSFSNTTLERWQAIITVPHCQFLQIFLVLLCAAMYYFATLKTVYGCRHT